MVFSGRSVVQIAVVLALALVPYVNPMAFALVGTSAPIEWIPVPQWLAGTWRADSQTMMFSYDYRLGQTVVDQPMTIKISRQSTIGMQQDAAGRIWHYTGTPYQRRIETTSYVEQQQIDRIWVIKSSPEELSTGSVATVSRTATDDGTPIDTFREETTTTYKPLTDGLIETQFEVQDFALDGRAIRTARSICTETRIMPFKPVDRDQRGDLRAKFSQFIAQGGTTIN